MLTVIVADPRGGERLVSTLRDLRDARMNLAMEVIAVIGGDDVSRLAELHRQFPLLTVLKAQGATDLGTLYAKGVEAAKGRYVLMLDGGARVDASTIEGMIHFMEKSQWVAVLAPRLLAPSGKEYASSRMFPTPASAVADFRGGQPSQDLAPRIQNALDRQVSTPKEVDAVASGCCMIKRQTVTEVGLWDSGYAAGGEALDWCKRARLKGFSVFYHPGLTAQLIEEPQDDPAAIAAQLASACRFIACYQGITALWALKFALTLLSLRDMLLGGGASLIPGAHRRQSRFAFWRAWHVMGAMLNPRRALASG